MDYIIIKDTDVSGFEEAPINLLQKKKVIKEEILNELKKKVNNIEIIPILPDEQKQEERVR